MRRGARRKRASHAREAPAWSTMTTSALELVLARLRAMLYSKLTVSETTAFWGKGATLSQAATASARCGARGERALQAASGRACVLRACMRKIDVFR